MIGDDRGGEIGHAHLETRHEAEDVDDFPRTRSLDHGAIDDGHRAGRIGEGLHQPRGRQHDRQLVEEVVLAGFA